MLHFDTKSIAVSHAVCACYEAINIRGKKPTDAPDTSKRILGTNQFTYTSGLKVMMYTLQYQPS